MGDKIALGVETKRPETKPQHKVIGQIFLMPDGKNFGCETKLSPYDTIKVLLALAASFVEDLQKKHGDQRIVVPDLVIP